MQLRRTLAVAATVTAPAVGGALPASADDTSTTFELTGGSLVLSVPATAALTDAAAGTTTGVVTTSIRQRGGPAG